MSIRRKLLCQLFIIGLLGFFLTSCDEEARYAPAQNPYSKLGFWPNILNFETNKVTTNFLRGFSFKDRLHVTVVGDNRTVISSSDGGKTWEKASDKDSGDLMDKDVGDLYDIVTLGSKYWVVGDKGMILKEDSPNHWTQVSLSIEGIKSVTFLKILFADSSHGIICGTSGTILTTDDGGQTWAKQKLTTDDTLDALGVQPGSATYWVAGDSGEVFKRGVTSSNPWQEVSMPTELRLTDVSFANPNLGYIVGYHGTILKTIDGGDHWVKSRQQKETIFAIDATYPDKLLASQGNGEILISTDGANSWVSTKIASVLLYRTRYLDPATIAFIGDSGIFGQQDVNHLTPLLDPGDSIYVVARQNNLITTSVGLGQLLVSPDCGRTWTKSVTADDVPASNLTMLPDSSFWLTTSHYLYYQGRPDRSDPLEKVKVPDGVDSIAAFLATNRSTLYLADNKANIWYSFDGGKGWTEIPWDETTLGQRGQIYQIAHFWKSIYVLGEKGILLKSDDSNPPRFSSIEVPDHADLLACTSSSPDKFWFASRSGLILSRDQEQWTKQQCDKQCDVVDINMIDDMNGLAAGNGAVFQTANGGGNWSAIDVPVINDENVQINAVSLAPTNGELQALLVGDNGLVARSTPSSEQPCEVRKYRCYSAFNGAVVEWQTANQPTVPNSECWDLSYLYKTNDGKVHSDHLINKDNPLSMTPENGGRTFSLIWHPDSCGVPNDTPITYYLSYKKPNFVWAPYTLGPYINTPKPWPTWFCISLDTLGIIGGYYLLCFGFYWLNPFFLHRIQQHFPLGPIAESDKYPLLSGVFNLLHVASLLPWLLTKSRVTEAWCQQFAQEKCSFDDLDADIRKRYLAIPACLDAWVKKQSTAYAKAFGKISSVGQRSSYVALPVTIANSEGGSRSEELSPQQMRDLLSDTRAVIFIEGIGGSGKTTLALELARWLLSTHPEKRLFPWLALPVLIEEDVVNDQKEEAMIVSAIKKELVSVFNVSIEEDFIRALLEHRRLVLIIDGLTERNEELQREFVDLYAHQPVGLCIATGRQLFVPRGVTSFVHIQPQPLQLDRLLTFICRYLDLRGKRSLLTDEKAVEFQKKLIEIMGSEHQSMAVTPLLVVILVEHLIVLLSEGAQLGQLPESIPAVFLSYLQRLTKSIGPFDQVKEELFALANCCLSPNWLPQDFAETSAREALTKLNTLSWERQLDKYCEANILERRDTGVVTVYRFELDPVAEYLAAMRCLERGLRNPVDWDDLVRSLPTDDDKLGKIRGFLTALRNCFSGSAVSIPKSLKEILEAHGMQKALRPIEIQARNS